MPARIAAGPREEGPRRRLRGHAVPDDDEEDDDDDGVVMNILTPFFFSFVFLTHIPNYCYSFYFFFSFILA